MLYLRPCSGCQVVGGEALWMGEWGAAEPSGGVCEGRAVGGSRTASSTFVTEDKDEATHEERALEEGQAARWGS